jgi:hypothetical protein
MGMPTLIKSLPFVDTPAFQRFKPQALQNPSKNKKIAYNKNRVIRSKFSSRCRRSTTEANTRPS